jgi:hypothetical protein
VGVEYGGPVSRKSTVPTREDFPPGTTFLIKEFDVPLARVPGQGWFNWIDTMTSYLLFDTVAATLDKLLTNEGLELRGAMLRAVAFYGSHACHKA